MVNSRTLCYILKKVRRLKGDPCLNTQKKNEKGQTEKEFLRSYNLDKYEKPSVTVDILVMGPDKNFENLKLLLIKRKNHPYIDCWALPGGFININESAYVAAGRELEEETGLTNVYLEQIYTFTQPGRDPRMRVIDIAYLALAPISDVNAGDDAKDAVWFNVSFEKDYLRVFNNDIGVSMEYSISEKVFRNGVIQYKNYVPTCLSEEKLAFDHVEVLLEGLLSMREKVERTDIAFNLVPEEFTLPDLQRIFEILLGKDVYKTNFRDKIMEKVIETGEKGKSITGGKACQLYRYCFRE